MPGLHLQLPWKSDNTLGQQRFRARDTQTEGQTENIRLLPIGYRCWCLPCAALHRRHGLEKRSISSWCYPGTRLIRRGDSLWLLLWLNSYSIAYIFAPDLQAHRCWDWGLCPNQKPATGLWPICLVVWKSPIRQTSISHAPQGWQFTYSA